MDNPVIIVFAWIFLAIILFLMFREVVCWYWKINKRVDLLEKIAKQLGVEGLTDTIEIQNTDWTCPKCSTENLYYKSICKKCGEKKPEGE